MTLGYTPRHGLSSVQYDKPALHAAFGAGSMTYDLLDRLRVHTNPAGTRQREFVYDDPGRLSVYEERKLVTVPPPPTCPPYATEPECLPTTDWGTMRLRTFAYDAVGNRTGTTYNDSTGASVPRSATLEPASNRYATYAGWTMTYDAEGNLVRRDSATQQYRYRWNSVGQLTSVVNPAGDSVAYGYNGLGMRVRRTLNGVTTRYLYDGDDLAAELDGSGNRIRTYTYWPGIDQPHSMRTWEGGQNGAIRYYALDLPANTVRGLFNASGGVTHQYSYGPFGEVQSASGSPANPLRFAARELDATTGLYYVRARWYDPTMGRFVSEDPIGLEGGINGYAYALDDPVNLGDPTGLDPCRPGQLSSRGEFRCGQVMRLRMWKTGPYSSMIDQTFTLGGLQSAFAGVMFGGGEDDGTDLLVPDEDEPGNDCGKMLGLVALQAIGDYLALSGSVGAYRSLRSLRLPGRIATRRAVEKVTVTDFARNAARTGLRSEVGKALAGSATQVLTGYVQGDSWDYGIPLWGTGRRIQDAVQCYRGAQ